MTRKLTVLTWLNRLCIVICGVMTFGTAFVAWVLHIQSVTTMITGGVGGLAFVFGISITFRWRPRCREIIDRVENARLVCSTTGVMHLVSGDDGLSKYDGDKWHVYGHGSGPTGGYNEIRKFCLEVPLLAGTHRARIIELGDRGGVPITNYWRCLVEMSDRGPVAICLQGFCQGRPSTLWWDLDRDDSAGGTFPRVQPIVQVIDHLEQFHTSVRDMDNRTDQLNAEMVELRRQLTEARDQRDEANRKLAELEEDRQRLGQRHDRLLTDVFALAEFLQRLHKPGGVTSHVAEDILILVKFVLWATRTAADQPTGGEAEAEWKERGRQQLVDILGRVKLAHVKPERLRLERQAA